MRSKEVLTVFICIFLFSCTQKKNDKTEAISDSIPIYLDKAANASILPTKRLEINKHAFKLLREENNTKYSRDQVEKVSRIFYQLKSEENFNEANEYLLNLSITKHDTANIAKCFNLKGNQYLDSGKNDSAFIYFLKAEKLFVKVKDSLSLGSNFIDKAFVQLYENDFSGCEISSIQALSLIKRVANPRKIYDAYNLIGISSNELKNYDNAITYHQKAQNIAEQSDPMNFLVANSLNNIGVVYQNLNQHAEAISYFKTALKDSTLLSKSPSLYAMIIDNLAYSQFKIGELRNLPSLFYKSLEIREKNEMTSGVIANKIHLSEFYQKQNDTIRAQKFATEALLLAKTTKVSGDMLGSLKQLSMVEHKNSSKYSKEYIRISDSLQMQERIARDKFARIAFETDEISYEKDQLADQNRTLLYFFIGTLMIGLLLFVIRTQRTRNRELLLKQAQQKANEDIYNMMISQQNKIEEGRIKEKKRIAQELHDGVLGRLFGARLNLDSLNRITDAEAIIKRNNYLEELKNIEQDIREISHDLNREKFVIINNFLAILNDLLEQQKASFAANVEITIDGDIKWDLINNTLKINIYRIIQESLQNINKYAEARNINITIKKAGFNLEVNIVDDGIGFATTTKRKGIGLQNMISRAQELEGILDLKSKKGKGTTITVNFPLDTSKLAST